MPTIQDRIEERDPSELRVLARHSLGFMQLGGETCVMIELTGRNPVTGATERTSYVVSLAGAVTICTDLTNVIESDAGILALVRSTLDSAQRLKRRPLASELPVVAIEGVPVAPIADDTPGPDGRSPDGRVALGVMGDGGILWCCANGCGICRDPEAPAGEEG